jgi:L-asparagine transporter-like permease
MTSDQLDPSANSPCTSTTLFAFTGAEFAAMLGAEISEAAAPVTRAVEKTRLFIIIMILFPLWLGGLSDY